MACAAAALAAAGCSPAGSVALYSSKFQAALVDVCRSATCRADVERHFERCLDGEAVLEMLLTVDPARSEQLNRELQRRTVECINRHSGTAHLTLGG